MPLPSLTEVHETWHAWAAGFVDGEGAIMLTYHREKSYNRRGRVERKAPQISLELRVGQTDEVPLQRLLLMYGGSVKALNMNASGRAKNRRPVYEWRLYGQQAIRALRLMRPYMMVKATQADLAIEYHEACFGVVGNFEQRLEFVEQMRALHHKGQHLVKLVNS